MVAVLFARSDSVYKQDLTLDVYDIEPAELPQIPFVLGQASHVIAQHRTLKDGSRMKKGHPNWRPEVTKAEREHTPPELAKWLVELAKRCKVK